MQKICHTERIHPLGPVRFLNAAQSYCYVQCGEKNSCMFEFPTFLPPTNLGLPMHSPSALKEHVSLNLARFFLLNPVLIGVEEMNDLFPEVTNPGTNIHPLWVFFMSEGFFRMHDLQKCLGDK